jgi:hypothetical protein
MTTEQLELLVAASPPVESVAVTVKLKVPAVGGVPVTAPVAGVQREAARQRACGDGVGVRSSAAAGHEGRTVRVPTVPVEVIQVTAMVGGAMTMEQLELVVAA